MLDIIRIAASRVGGVPELASRIGVTRQAIYQWREVPASRVGAIAEASGLPRADLRPDLYGFGNGGGVATATVPAMDRLGAAIEVSAAVEVAEAGRRDEAPRHDLVLWAEHQAEALATGRDDLIDRDRLVDLLEAVADEARREVEARLTVVVVRLLKWVHRPDRRAPSWLGVVTAERARLLDRLRRSPSLRAHAAAALPLVHAEARARAAAETGLALASFPAECPFELDQLLDPGFLPKG
jgi:hypothetical protein